MTATAVQPVLLAQYLVNQFGHLPGGVTPLKLQKLLYYVKAWSLVEGEDLVDGPFEKWPHGPVNRTVYEHYKGFGRSPLQPVTLGPSQKPQGAAREFVDFVGHSYARFPALVLSKMTHEEEPWKRTPLRQEIPPSLIRAYYEEHPFSANIPFDPEGKPYVPVQSDMDRAFTLDMGADDARRASTFRSYQEYVERLERAGLASRDVWLSRLLA